MIKFESRIGKLNYPEERVYDFLSDFNNLEQFIPKDQVKDWESTEDTCKFKIPELGEIGLKIIEKEPHKLIKITGEETTPLDFFMWIQLKQLKENDTRIRITIKAALNPVMKSVISKPIEKFLERLIDEIEKLDIK